MKINSRTTLTEIRSALIEDGFEDLLDRAEDIKRAALRGALLWTRRSYNENGRARIRTCIAGRIDKIGY